MPSLSKLARFALITAAFVPIICLRGQNKTAAEIALEANKQRADYDIELRKIELEEKRLYLASLQGSHITETKPK